MLRETFIGTVPLEEEIALLVPGVTERREPVFVLRAQSLTKNFHAAVP